MARASVPLLPGLLWPGSPPRARRPAARGVRWALMARPVSLAPPALAQQAAHPGSGFADAAGAGRRAPASSCRVWPSGEDRSCPSRPRSPALATPSAWRQVRWLPVLARSFGTRLVGVLLQPTIQLSDTSRHSLLSFESASWVSVSAWLRVRTAGQRSPSPRRWRARWPAAPPAGPGLQRPHPSRLGAAEVQARARYEQNCHGNRPQPGRHQVKQGKTALTPHPR